MSISCDVSEATEFLAVEQVKTWLRDHNVGAVPDLWDKLDRPAHGPRPLFVEARQAGQLVGGLIASTEFAWLKIDVMSVAPEHRRRGIGAAMLASAEEEGHSRGCRHVYVDTMSYQAPGFYEKQGYTRVGFLEDWDSHGHDKSFFRKPLTPA